MIPSKFKKGREAMNINVVRERFRMKNALVFIVSCTRQTDETISQWRRYLPDAV
jgi:hypothetical protein